MSDRLTSKDVLIPNLNDDELVKLSQFVHRDVHDLELPVRIFTSVDADG